MISFHKAALLAGVFALAACSDSTSPSFNDPSTRVTVDASANTGAYLLLGNPATVSTSANWDLYFNATEVAANGGASGAGDVGVYAVTNNTTKTDGEILAQTQQDGLTAFNAVTSASIPADSTLFKKDAVALAIDDWYTMNRGAFTPTAEVWSVRLASAAGQYAKFHALSITPTGPPPAPANIVIQWAVQTSVTAAMGANQQATLALTLGTTTYVNLSTGTVTSGTAPTTWDVSFLYSATGFTINVNGAGGAAAISLTEPYPTETYATLTSATSLGGVEIPSNVFKVDGTGGTFATTPWFRYDIDPANAHQITPTYDVYIVKRGTTYYKVQIISYYGKGGDNTGTTRHIVVRYAALVIAG